MIRVLRVIEYTYPTIEDYWTDRSRWTMKSPAPTTDHSWWKKMDMQSSIVSETIIDEDEAKFWERFERTPIKDLITEKDLNNG